MRNSVGFALPGGHPGYVAFIGSIIARLFFRAVLGYSPPRPLIRALERKS
jgi:hypothetical protein